MIIKYENSAGVYQDDIGIMVESCHGDWGGDRRLVEERGNNCCAFFDVS